jgi:hypothetical protein
MRQLVELADLRFKARHLRAQVGDLFGHGRRIATLKRHVVHISPR